MKKHILFALFAMLSLLFFGCPTGIDHPIGMPGTEKIDPALLGTWVADDSEAEVQELKITKKDEYTYAVEVVEQGSTYGLETNNLTAWITVLEGKKFFYLKPDNESQYFHYMIVEMDKESLVTCDVSLLDGGVDAVTSTASFRDQVKRSMKMAEYCSETITWYRE